MSDFDAVDRAIEDIRAGRIVLVVDDEDRENEGDMVLAAERMTPEHVNFLSKYARGLVCVACVASRLDELHLGPMAPENTSLHHTSFTVSVDYRHGTTTGISAHDRAETIRAFARADIRSQDFDLIACSLTVTSTVPVVSTALLVVKSVFSAIAVALTES